MNRASEIGWMIARTLPFLQRPDLPFDDTWKQQWQVLDESFAQMVVALDTLGKKIAKVFEAMVHAKFPFGPDMHYVERG